MRKCRQCGIEKPLTEFAPERRTCKACVRVWFRGYRKANAEYINARRREWRAKTTKKGPQ